MQDVGEDRLDALGFERFVLDQLCGEPIEGLAILGEHFERDGVRGVDEPAHLSCRCWPRPPPSSPEST